MKFSIVTPAWNVGPWLQETIESVLSQAGEFELEYIVVTDPSHDDTVEIARDFTKRIHEGIYPSSCKKLTMQHIELHGSGSMYQALNQGFAACSGDINAWLAGDDLYRPRALEGVRKVFETYPDIQWLKGVGGTVNETGMRVNEGTVRLYHQPWLKQGVYGIEAYHVNQDSVFWRRTLWDQSGPFPEWLKSMGDYWLWLQFAKYAPLISFDVPVSDFRKREGQDSRINQERCLKSMWRARGNTRPFSGWVARLFFYPYDHLLPTSLKSLAERMYPALFPQHNRRFITLQDGSPKWHTAQTFVHRT